MNRRISFSRRTFVSVPVLIFVCALSATAQDRPPTLVVTDQVREMEFHDQITLVGRTEAWNESQVVAEVAGKIESINAAEGTRVSRGTSLVTVDPDRIRFAEEAKRAQAAQAAQQAKLAKINLERVEELIAKSLVPQSTLDSALAWVTSSQERYNELEAERQQLAIDLQRCTIRAPYDGFTGRRYVDVGEWVSPGTPVFEMVDLSRVRIQADLPERHFGRLSIGSAVTVIVSANDAAPLRGVVSGVAPNASAETHTFPVIIEVPEPDTRLAGGMLVRVRLSFDDQFTSLAVSKDAIIRQGDQTIVYTVFEDKAVPVPVTTSSTNGQMVAVRADRLSAGMPVVIRGNERIFPGSPVKTASTGSEVGFDPSSGDAQNDSRN